MGKNLLLSGQSRIFIQTNPNAGFSYFDCLSLDGPSQDLGGSEPIYCPSRVQRNAFDIVGQKRKAQALGTTGFKSKADRFLVDAWWDVKNAGCPFNLAAINGACQRPDDPTQWDSVLLLIGVQLSKLALSELNAQKADDNNEVELTGDLTFTTMTPIRKMVFGAVGEAQVLCEISDLLVHDVATCGDCGTPSDGCSKWYALELSCSGSPGLSSQVIYSLDGALTWAALDIPVLGGLSALRAAAVGERYVAVSEAAGAYVWIDFTSLNAGISTAWAKVTSGFVAGKSPRCIYSYSPTITFMGAQGGYVYLLTDPGLAVTTLTDGSVTAQNLNDIHGVNRTVVAVGASNAVIKSDNLGDTWTLITGPAVGVNLSAVWCSNETTWFVATGAGALYRTTNGGTTWTQITLTAGITTVNDIQFTPDGAIGYLAVEIGGAGRVYRSIDQGNTWQYTNAIASLPASQRINVAVPCGYNTVGAGGRKTVAGDGLLAFAS